MAKKMIGKQHEENEAPAPKKKGSLAAAFNASKGSVVGMSVGKHTCNITDFQFIENEKGMSAMVEYTAHDDDDDAGKKNKGYYSLMTASPGLDKNGDPIPGEIKGGVDFLKGDLAKLGYEDIDFDDLEATFAEIRKEEPLVEVKCVQNGQYFNVYLQGVSED
jgi:hypothetical protein